MKSFRLPPKEQERSIGHRYLKQELGLMVTNEALAFEDLEIGERWTSSSRVILPQDVQGFADLTGDRDRLHTDPEFAAAGPFGRPVAHGLLGISILAGLSSTAPLVQTAALVDIRSWSFTRPIFIGDAVHAVTEIIDLKPHGRRHGEVHWYRQLINQHGEKVQEGILVTLVARRIPLPNKRTNPRGIESVATTSATTVVTATATSEEAAISR